jgi:hypothetical protein
MRHIRSWAPQFQLLKPREESLSFENKAGGSAMKGALCVFLLSLSVSVSAQVSFEKPITTYGGVNGESIAVGKFGGENIDIMVMAQYGSNPASVIVDEGNGNGTFRWPYVRSWVSGEGFYPGKFISSSSELGFVVVRPNPQVNINTTGWTDSLAVYLPCYYSGRFCYKGTLLPPPSLDLCTCFCNDRWCLYNWSAGIPIIGDFLGNGKKDVVLEECYQLENNIGEIGSSCIAWLWAGNGDGTFQSPEGVTDTGFNISATDAYRAGDFNGDGKLDLMGFYYGGIEVSLNEGNGNFSYPIISPGCNAAPLVGDFNGDGKLDVACAAISLNTTTDPAEGGIDVYLGNGDGTFQSPIFTPSPYFLTMDTTSWLIKGGHLGITSAYTDGGSNHGVAIFLGNGDGTFKVQYIPDTPVATTVAVATADFNKDGWQDLAVLHANPIADKPGRVQVYINKAVKP